MAIGIGLVRAGFRPVPWVAYVPEVDLPVDDAAYPTMRLIDPYGETMFSSYQCDAMLPDFERLATDRPGPDTQAAVDLVRRCARENDTALWFIGD
jgi:hypothetical protein